MDAEHISLHRYIRNAPSDTEVLAEHHLRADRSAWPLEKHIWKHEKLGRMKELGGGEQWDWTRPQWLGEMKQGSDPISGQLSG